MSERCNHPLGSSENLAVVCRLPRDHAGPHRATLQSDPDYRCPKCGFYYDTPNHELGCAGKENPQGKELASRERVWTVVPEDERALSIRSYRDGDDFDAAFVVCDAARTFRVESELANVRADYRQLQELTGGALFRAHVARGDRELDAAKLAEQLDRYREALQEIADLDWQQIGAKGSSYTLRAVAELIDVAREALK